MVVRYSVFAKVSFLSLFHLVSSQVRIEFFRLRSGKVRSVSTIPIQGLVFKENKSSSDSGSKEYICWPFFTNKQAVRYGFLNLDSVVASFRGDVCPNLDFWSDTAGTLQLPRPDIYIDNCITNLSCYRLLYLPLPKADNNKPYKSPGNCRFIYPAADNN